MIDDLAGKPTGERIKILRERRGLSRPTLAGLVGMSASWLKDVERGRLLPPRLPTLVKLTEALGLGDVALLAGTDMRLGDAASIPMASFARIPHEAVPAIRDALRCSPSRTARFTSGHWPPGPRTRGACGMAR
ncbi:helix-turn-helix domain-containing protein [Actinomadura sp. 6N118]|uniref:helix-turn-helix domain-containing protein n=1 Tax=Actinomadura sp. 6N118 TaxID=3375151 RepID=UPI003796DFD2